MRRNRRIVVLACENDAYPALDMAGLQPDEVQRLGAGSCPCGAWDP